MKHAPFSLSLILIITSVLLTATLCYAKKTATCDTTTKQTTLNKTNPMTTSAPETQKIHTTASGLQYQIITEGTGASPAKGQHVTVHYTGWLDDANKEKSIFDSSIKRGTPFTFIIGKGQVIKGWDEGVASMKIGEKRKLIIPAALGYGAHGAGNVIPPHATLFFEVELLNIA